MFTPRWTWIALAILVVAAAGCRRRSHHSTANADDDIFTTDSFPGASVQHGNVGDDQRAFSNAGESVFGSYVQKNGDRGTAIASYVTKGAEPTAPNHVYVHYFDGEQWTPPVALAAPDVDFSQSAFPAAIAFINTSDHPSPAARERDGDALVFWVAGDQDGDGLSPADDANACLFVTYFDVTHASEPDLRYGFQALGTRLSPRDRLNENVFGTHLVTDGICGEYRKKGPIPYGDQTTGIVIAWTQFEFVDALTPTDYDQALWSAWFDLASNPDPESPVTPAPAVRLPTLGFGASDSGLSAEETLVSSLSVSYNNVLFFRVASRATAGSGVPGNDFPPGGLGTSYGNTMGDGDDVTLQAVAFDLADGSFSGPNLLNASAPDSTDAVESNASFLYTNTGLLPSPVLDTQSVWGSDEGLAQLVIVYAELASDADAVTDFGSLFLDGALVATGLDEATGTPDSHVLLSPDDPVISDTVLPGYVQVRPSRNGDYLWIAWLQPDGAGGSDDLALRAAQIRTTRPAADGSFAVPPISLATSPTLTLSADIDGFDVGWLQIQNGLGYACGAQSDPDVFNLFFEHSDGTRDEVFVARLTTDHAVTPLPLAVVTPFETFEDGEMAGSPIRDTGIDFNSCDAGADGDALAVYRRDVDATAATDFRFFAKRTGDAARVEVGSGSIHRQARAGVISLVVTPPGSEIGTWDPVAGTEDGNRSHPAELVHALFREDRYVTGSGTGPALRARVFVAGQGDGSLAQAIEPPVGAALEAPFELELPNVDPDTADSPKIVGIGVEDTTVGIFFTELGHVYYQEFTEDAGAWWSSDGVSNPALVDDDSGSEVLFAQLTTDNCTCSTLRGAICTWIKEISGGSGQFRLQVRVRD